MLKMFEHLFKEFRNAGLLTLEGELCCNNCSGTEVTNRAVAKIKEGAKKEDIVGCVYYHEQEEDSYKETRTLHLAYGPMDSTEFGVIGITTVECGELICKIVEENGFKFEWDGSGARKIKVSL